MSRIKEIEYTEEWANKILDLLPWAEAIAVDGDSRIYAFDAVPSLDHHGTWGMGGPCTYLGYTSEKVDYKTSMVTRETLADKYPKDALVLAGASIWRPRYSAGEVDPDGALLVYANGTTSLTSKGSMHPATLVRDYDEARAWTAIWEE